jgi:hypothetical protein
LQKHHGVKRFPAHRSYVSQDQPLLAEATPEDITIAATMAAQSSATRIVLVDMWVRTNRYWRKRHQKT